MGRISPTPCASCTRTEWEAVSALSLFVLWQGGLKTARRRTPFCPIIEVALRRNFTAVTGRVLRVPLS